MAMHQELPTQDLVLRYAATGRTAQRLTLHMHVNCTHVCRSVGLQTAQSSAYVRILEAPK